MHQSVVLPGPVRLRDWRPDLPAGDLRSISLHWTAYDYEAVFSAYHYCLRGVSDPIVVATHDLRANMRDVRGDPTVPYAAHTAGRNSWSIGLAVCAMADATPSDFGRYPLGEAQIDGLCTLARVLADAYGIGLDAIRTHAEAALEDGYFGASSEGRALGYRAFGAATRTARRAGSDAHGRTLARAHRCNPMTEDGALRIAADFGVDVRAAHANELRGGYSNESWHVYGPAADIVVRRYGRLHVTRAALLFEHAVAQHLAAKLAIVRAPLADATGDTLRSEGGAFVGAIPWIGGSTGARDDASAQSAARALARFHLAGRDMHVSGGMRSTRFLGLVPWLIARFRRFAAPDSPLARALPWTDMIVALSASTARTVRRAASVPHAIVHGDPNPANFVMNDGDVRGMIDFDFVHETERIYDVGAFIDEFARTDDDAPLALERIAPLLAAYESEATLTSDERALLPDAMLRRAATLVWYVITRHGERTPGDIGGAPRYAARLREIARLAVELAHAG